MKKGSVVFLAAFCIYILLVIVLSIILKDSGMIQKCTFAVIISSVFFSLADILKNKYDIDEKEVYLTINIIKDTKELKKKLTKQLIEKYGQKVEKLVDSLLNILNDDEINKFDEIILKKTYSEEDNLLLSKYRSKLSQDLYNDFDMFITDTSMSENYDEKDIVLDEEHLFEIPVKKRKKIYGLQIMGVLTLLLLLSTDGIDFNKYYYISNISTLIAFFMLMLNFLLGEVYREKDIRILEETKKELGDLAKGLKGRK